MLRAKFEKLDKPFKSHKSVVLRVTLTNDGSDDLHVLTWNTPLDSLPTDCLEIKLNGKRLEFDGPIVKRAAPTAKDYLLIKAGQSVTADYVVSDAYDTSKPGKYQVKIKTPIMDGGPKQKGLATSGRLRVLQAAHPIVDKTNFEVQQGVGKRLTLGENARRKELKSAKAKSSTKKSSVKKNNLAATTGAMLPKFTGGTAAQKSTGKKAHQDGYQLCVNALANLTNNARYVEWFGAHTTTRLKKVKSNYTAVKKRMETIQFTYNLTLSGCNSGVYAYTYKDTSTIWFCDQFWAAPATGTDSKAGTVLHEHTHSDAMTDDNVYGQPGCRALAISNPTKAIQNADSHEYYAGG
ncbi:MAG: M35 family metallopeptidase [Pirellulales bacterium]